MKCRNSPIWSEAVRTRVENSGYWDLLV